MSVIRFDHVSKSYDLEPVLVDLSFEVREAQTKIVLGGSGSGKSTILKMILGLVRPDSGEVFVDGNDITELTESQLMPIRKQMGMVFQEGALFDSETVAGNVAYRMREEGKLSEREIRDVVERLLSFVGLEHAIDKFPSELSGGMRRRVAIARALVGQPRIMLYDEPTAGLDPLTSRTICDLVIKLRDLEGVASVFVTHDLHAAKTLAAEIAEVGPRGEIYFRDKGSDFCLVNTEFLVLQSGSVLFEGSEEQLRSCSEPYIREFLE